MAMRAIRVRHLVLTVIIAIAAAAAGMFCSRFIHQSQSVLRHLKSSSSLVSNLLSTMSSGAATSCDPGPGPVVVVVGSGLAGLAAAHEALQAGAQVHMLERSPKAGGNSIKASSGINGAGTKFQQRSGIKDNDELFYQDTVRSAGSRYRDQKGSGASAGPGPDRDALIAALTDQSGQAVEWLADAIGVDLSVVAPLGGHSVARTHRGAGNLPPGAAIVTTLLKKLEEDPNFQITTSAEVTSLRATDDNLGLARVGGVQFTQDSQHLTLPGPVVLAAGGFAGDAHGLLAQHRPDLAGVPSTNEARPGPHGLLSAVGAELVDMDSVQVHPTGFVDPEEPLSRYKFLAAEMLRGEGGILLSAQGRRFVDELQTREFISKAIMEAPSTTTDGGEGTRHWDVTILLDPGACEAAGSHLGFYEFKGLMERKKVRDLDERVIRTVDRYAGAVQAGRDEDHGRTKFGRWTLKPGESNREETVCVGKVTPVVHFTMGGAAFDESARVLRRGKDGRLEPIAGLWAAGEVTGGIHGDNRLGGSSLLECAVFGRIAGRQAAEAAKAALQT